MQPLGTHGHFGASEFGEDRVAKEFNHSAFVRCINCLTRKCLQDFNELQRAAFVLCGTITVARDISKPQRNEMMG